MSELTWVPHMLNWFNENFPERSYSIFRIKKFLYYDRCNLVEVATEHPWISATALAFLSAFMLISALIVISVLLAVFVIARMIFSAVCIGLGNLLSVGPCPLYEMGAVGRLTKYVGRPCK